MTEELEKEKPEGEEALNELFKSIYGKVTQMATWSIYSLI